MQRPVMDITYLDDDAAAAAAARRYGRRHATAAQRLATDLASGQTVVRILMYDPLAHAVQSLPQRRRLAVLALRARARLIVWRSCRCSARLPPARSSIPARIRRRCPASLIRARLAFTTRLVSFKSDDNVRLDAWLVPALEASKVLDQKEKILREKHPAVVLLHNYGDRRQQMLSLIRPLHDAGFVVLIPALRGCGTSESAGQTFGLHEALDVKAAVDLLRRRNFVDPERVALIGVGSGANAAMLAANADTKILAMVLESPTEDINEVINEHIAPKNPTSAGCGRCASGRSRSPTRSTPKS